MRGRKWIAPIVGLLLLATGSRSAWSQAPVAVPNSASVGAPGYARPANYGYQQPPVAPPMPPSSGSPVDINQFVPPPTFNPWPAVSPYDYDYNRYSVQDGVWSQETTPQHAGRRYMGGVEYLFNRTKKLSGIFGDNRAASYKDVVLPILREDPFDLDDLADAYEGLSPMQQQGGQNQNQNNLAQVDIGPGNNLYDTVNFNEFNELKAPGTRLNYGWLNPDDSGFMMSFMWSSDVSERLGIDPGLGRGDQTAALLQLINTPEDPNDATTVIPRNLSDLAGVLGPTIDVDLILQNNLLNLRGIPFDDGTVTELDDGTVFGGAAAPFDLEFNLEIESETYGTSLMSYLNPIYKANRLKVRPIVGLRYMHIREALKFRGIDSGLTYDDQDPDDPIFPDVKLHSLPNGFDDDGDGIVDNAGLVEDMFQAQGGGGGGGQGMFRFIQYRSPFVSPIESTFSSESRVHLVGPEIGMQYEMGGGNFRMLGHTTVAMLGNFERLALRGNNFGVITRDNNFVPRSPANPDPNAFSDRETHSHVSPLLEQSISFEGPIFRYLPVFQRFRVLNGAVFRIGYTYTLINEVVRGPSSVRYTSNPAQGLFPEVSAKRGNWYVRNFNLGVHWSF